MALFHGDLGFNGEKPWSSSVFHMPVVSNLVSVNTTIGSGNVASHTYFYTCKSHHALVLRPYKLSQNWFFCVLSSTFCCVYCSVLCMIKPCLYTCFLTFYGLLLLIRLLIIWILQKNPFWWRWRGRWWTLSTKRYFCFHPVFDLLDFC